MKAKHLILTLAATGVASMFSACSLDPYELPSQEQYTRAFIKEFGLIDPNQDWNLAKAGSVTVNVAGHANSVKVYARVGNTYYLTARLVDIEGSVNIPIDIPESTNDLMVKVDGNRYYTTNGGTVSIAPSRAAETGSNSYTTASDQTITVSVSDATGDKQYFKFNAQQMGPILAPTTNKNYDGKAISGEDYYWPDYYSITKGYEGLQENPDTMPGGRVPEKEVNLLRSDIFQDFTVTPAGTSITIYPMYWYTDQTHTIGIYFIDDAGNPVRDGAGEIIQVPVYTSKGANDIEWYKQAAPPAPILYGQIEYKNMPTELQAMCPATFNSGDNDGDGINDEFIAKFKNWYTKNYTAAHMMYASGSDFAYPDDWSVYPLPSPELYEIASIQQKADQGTVLWMEITFTVKSDGYPDGYPNKLKEINGEWVSYVDNFTYYNGSSHTSASYAFKEEALMRSRGIEIDITGWNGKLGMYTTFGAKTLYSQRALNTEINMSSLADDNPLKHSFAASYFHPVTHNLFYSFEDWTGGGSDADLNDIVFMIDGVDKMDTDKGEIPVKVKETNETDDPISWLIAAEDLGTTDDFDFNDVVFTINSITTNTTTVTKEYGDDDKTNLLGSTTKTETHKEVTINALAAGGTLPVWLHYYDSASGTDYIIGPNDQVHENTAANATAIEACEWHRWFRTANLDMINTGYQTVNNPLSCNIGHSNTTKYTVDGTVTGDTPENSVSSEWKIAAFEDFTMAAYSQTLTDGRVNGFYITVRGYSSTSDMQALGGTTHSDKTGAEYTIGASRKGDAPQMFVIPDVGYGDGKWRWPTERYHILECYPGFADWVTESTATTNEWHKQAPQSSTCARK